VGGVNAKEQEERGIEPGEKELMIGEECSATSPSMGAIAAASFGDKPEP